MPSLILYAVIFLAVAGVIGGGVYKVKKWGGDEVRAEWEADKAAARKREQELSAFAAKALADERKKRRVVVQTITKEVDREVAKPVYRDVCLPPAGLCLANAAINGSVPAGCLSDGTVPAPKPPG